ncbi:hypothetical protein [Paraburkholderia ginsengisoli]|uniref:Uncharacterized protein n=1 Tax=Paraburkholderia ginsengisoli TaxID=311231 RepID=A0A7T4N499_9BURK|nr:hypothetical protein [Paraburkholderia ginsengisoli]QQC64987.1 hypothetical protein I6I06_05815 [Paraburkholderia ginsengisoli]
MCPAYAKKAGNERKKWAKLVPASVDAVQYSTGVGLLAGASESAQCVGCTATGSASTNKVHTNSRAIGMIQMRAKYSILITVSFDILTC